MSTYRDVLPYACQGCKLVTNSLVGIPIHSSSTMLNDSGTQYDRTLYACSIDKMEELKVPYITFGGATPSECPYKQMVR